MSALCNAHKTFATTIMSARYKETGALNGIVADRTFERLNTFDSFYNGFVELFNNFCFLLIRDCRWCVIDVEVQMWMATSLAKTEQEDKDIGVVFADGSLANILAYQHLGVLFQLGVEVQLFRRELGIHDLFGFFRQP